MFVEYKARHLESGDITERLPEYYHYWDHIELGLRRLEEEACQQTSIADQPAAEKAAETSPREGGSAENEPVVSEVTITFRHEHFGLQTNQKSVALSVPEGQLIMQFIRNVKDGFPGEVVEWKALHDAIKDKVNCHKSASDALRQLKSKLNQRLVLELGCPVDGDRYLRTRKRLGVSLNTSIKWSLDKDCQLLLREVMASSVDPKVLEDTRPNSGQRLPSRFREDRSLKDRDD